MAHHKSNKAVEGNPDSGHGGGLPRRPDEEELDERTEEDRELVGLDPEDADVATDGRERSPFPPTGYQD